jgi:ribosomal protein S21
MTNASIKAAPGDSIEWLLRGFKREVQKSDMFRDLRKHEHFQPKSAKRRSKRARAQARRATSLSKSLKAERRYGPDLYA